MRSQHISALLLVLAAWAFAGSLAFARDDAPTRAIKLSVTILDPNGVQVTEFGVGVAVVSNESQSHTFEPANNLGQFIAEFSPPLDAREFRLTIGFLHTKSMTPKEMVAANRRFQEFNRACAVRLGYKVPLTPDQSDYAITIQLTPAITVRGRLISPTGEQIKGWPRARGCLSWGGKKPDETGAFELIGIPKGEPAELVFSGNWEKTKIVRLSAEQTLSDIDVGDITLERIGGTSTVRLLDVNEANRKSGRTIPYTVISANGQEIVTVVVDTESGVPRVIWPEASKGWLEPDRYFLVPDLFPFEPAWQLLDLIRSGKAENHPKLLSFDAAANAETTVIVDRAAVRRNTKLAAEAEGLATSH